MRQHQQRMIEQYEPPTEDELSSLSSRSSSISFGSVQVREYDRCLLGAEGQMTEVSNALALDWEFTEAQPLPVDDFERHQQEKLERQRQQELEILRAKQKKRSGIFPWSKKPKKIVHIPKCHPVMLAPCSKDSRFKLLAQFGYSEKELMRAEKERIEKNIAERRAEAKEQALQ